MDTNCVTNVINNYMNNEVNNEKTKLSIKKINTFNSIEIKEKSLILCDIDDTVLRYKLTLDDFVVKTKKYLEDVNDFIDMENTLAIASDEFADYREKNIPFHTDKEGFCNFEKKIIETNSKIIFITSRSLKFKKVTESQLESIGIDSNKYPIHFTFDHKMSKADYIEKFIETSQFSQVYFIDDLPTIVKQVKFKFPHFECFIYKYNK
jgi:hypothetical protein